MLGKGTSCGVVPVLGRINGYLVALTDAFIEMFTNQIGWGLDKIYLLFPRSGVIHRPRWCYTAFHVVDWRDDIVS